MVDNFIVTLRKDNIVLKVLGQFRTRQDAEELIKECYPEFFKDICQWSKFESEEFIKIEQPKSYYEFDVVMWDETGNKLLFEKRVSIQRQSLNSARNVMDKKYKMSEGYFYELNRHYTQ